MHTNNETFKLYRVCLTLL